MTKSVDQKLRQLRSILESMKHVAVAVSGGVDSVTLAFVAHEVLRDGATMFHAVSPAVPPDGTERTRRIADSHGWQLRVVSAGEFDDPNYVRNPVDRCFYCKSNLYGVISAETEGIVVSGTNADDISDYRPGLKAAKNYGVRHPFVEADIDKPMVRRLAARFGLKEVVNLPASPCLSSRLETGIRVDPDSLGLVHRIESLIRSRLGSRTIRCRIRHEGLVIELEHDAYEAVTNGGFGSLRGEVEQLVASLDSGVGVRYEVYRMGSAFVHA